MPGQLSTAPVNVGSTLWKELVCLGSGADCMSLAHNNRMLVPQSKKTGCRHLGIPRGSGSLPLVFVSVAAQSIEPQERSYWKSEEL